MQLQCLFLPTLMLFEIYSDTRATAKSDDDGAPKQTLAASSDTHNKWISSPRGEKECNPPNKDVFTMAALDNMLFSLLHMPRIHSALHSLTVTRSAENKLVSFPCTARLRHWRQGRFATTIICKIWNTYWNCSLVFHLSCLEYSALNRSFPVVNRQNLRKGLGWYLINKNKCCILCFYILIYLSFCLSAAQFGWFCFLYTK